MAQMATRSKRVEGMSDLDYDLVSCLAEDLEAIDVLDTYINDAHSAGDSNVEQLFTQIRDDEMKHCDALKRVIEERVKQGKFK